MSKKSSIRVTINQMGLKRAILTIEEDANGDLRLITRLSRLQMITSPNQKIKTAPPVEVNRFSVHVSEQSVMNINTIKHTTKSEGEEKDSFVVYTKALKHHNKYFPVFSRYCSELIDKASQINEEGELDVHIGDLESRLFSLVFEVFVGRSDRVFDNDFIINSNVNIKVIPFKYFNIVLLWTYLNIPAGPVGICSFAGLDSSKVHQSELMSDKSFDEQECLDHFQITSNNALFAKVKFLLEFHFPKDFVEYIYNLSIFSNFGSDFRDFAVATNNRGAKEEIKKLLNIYDLVRKVGK